MDSDDEREDETPSWRGVPGSIILINVFGGSGSAAVAHAATCRLIRQYLRSATSQNVGVCLYGTEDPKTAASTLATQDVVDVFPLATPTLTEFEKLRNLQLSSYSPAKELKLSDGLWHCSKMFTHCKKQLSSRSVIMLTALDVAPVATDQKPTLKRVVDLVDSNIEIRIINIAENDYKIDPFYEKFLIEANKGGDFNMPQRVWDIKEIEKLMYQQSHRHLAVAKLNFEIGNKVAIGVGVYNLLSTNITQKKVNLERETNAPVSSITKTMKVSRETSIPDVTMPMDVDEESVSDEPKQMPVLKSEILFCQEYGGRNIAFTSSEIKTLKNPFGPPKMKLLGFKPASFMSMQKWFLKPGYFLFPNESLIEGSTVAFKALYQACIETGMVGICVLSSRINARPYIVALSPSKNPLGLQIDVGFDVIPIPFVENVRDLPHAEEVEDLTISEEQLMLMKDIVKHLQFDYRADMFENPKIQSEYRAVEAKALEDDDFDVFTDTTKRDQEIFEHLQEDLFEELFGPFGQIAPKRTATGKEPRTSKKAKPGEIDESILKSRVKNKSLNQYNIGQLRDILKAYGGSDMPALTGLKKNDLVNLVYKYCS